MTVFFRTRIKQSCNGIVDTIELVIFLVLDQSARKRLYRQQTLKNTGIPSLLLRSS